MPAPIPFDAPVTTATFPFSLLTLVLLDLSMSFQISYGPLAAGFDTSTTV
jgi:hypothetical protein